MSPITAASLTADIRRVGEARYHNDEIWWTEVDPQQGGRTTIRTRRHGRIVDLLPEPFDARSRVHEYGGSSYTVADDVIYFCNYADQRIYRVTGLDVTPVTRANANERFAELDVVDGALWAVRECHEDGTISRDIVRVDIDSGEVSSIVTGTDFVAYPRLNPDGTKLAWISWNHPQMPWDGTFLNVANIVDGSVAVNPQIIHGSTELSVLQPEWRTDTELIAISDNTGFWNLYSFDTSTMSGAEPARVAPRGICPDNAEYGGPLWTLGTRFYTILPDPAYWLPKHSG